MADKTNTWLSDVIKTLSNLGGEAHYNDIYLEAEKVRETRGATWPSSAKAIIRRTLEEQSSDTESLKGDDLFYSVLLGLGKGVWGLRNFNNHTPQAIDIDEAELPNRTLQETYRILRDTGLARKLKKLHNFKCQICGETLHLPNGKKYAEAHHIRPLGGIHSGPDIAQNIIVLCPNHHVLCDYLAIELDASQLRKVIGHEIGRQYIDYHNRQL